MPSKLEKERRKALRKGYKNSEKEEFFANLPASKEILKELFDWLDAQSQKQNCDDTLKQTRIFISQKNLSENELLEWLKNQGGHCDCEVLANIEEQFDE